MSINSTRNENLSLRSRFQNIKSTEVDQLVRDFGSPVSIIDKSGIINRLREFKQVICEQYDGSVVAVSYKTSMLHGLLALLHGEGVYAEVVSGAELELAHQLNVPGHEIVFNGPMKTDAELLEAFSSEIYLHCDHMDEVYRAEQQARVLGEKRSIGIRLNFPEEAGWNRFGFEVGASDQAGDAHECVSYIVNSEWLDLSGLHVQIGTNIRELINFANVSKRVAEFAQSLKTLHGIELDWIDLGGGLAGISPTVEEAEIEVHLLPSIEEYANAIITPLLGYLQSLHKPAKLIFEPGRTIFEPFGGILMTVVGRRPCREPGVEGYIVDAGLNAIPDADQYKHPIKSVSPISPQYRTRLFGPSCMQRDVIRDSVELPSLSVGDHMIMYGTGGYSIATSYSFVRYRPGVVLWDEDGNFEWLRQPENLAHTSKLEVLT